MIEWKRLYMKPAGSLPGGVVTQWGVGAITVFILLFLTYLDLAWRRRANRGCRINRGSHNRAAQLYPTDDSASGC